MSSHHFGQIQDPQTREQGIEVTDMGHCWVGTIQDYHQCILQGSRCVNNLNIDHSILLVYDTSSHSTFDNIENFWLNEIESYAEKSAELLLLGNKCDLEKREVSTEKAQQYAKTRNMEFFETSAKTAECVEQAFECIAKKLMVKRDKSVQEKKLKRKQQRVIYIQNVDIIKWKVVVNN